MNVLPVDPAKVSQHLGRMDVPRCDTSAGAVTSAQLCQEGFTFDVQSGGASVGAYNLQIEDAPGARVAWVTAFGGQLDGVDLTATVEPAIQAQARALGAQQIAMQTKRRGLIRKLQKLGYEVTGVTLRKRLT